MKVPTKAPVTQPPTTPAAVKTNPPTTKAPVTQPPVTTKATTKAPAPTKRKCSKLGYIRLKLHTIQRPIIAFLLCIL